MTDPPRSSDDDAPITLLDLLRKRRYLLAQLELGPHDKQSLVDATDTSRSTVDRALRRLTAAGLVQTDGDVYELSLCGRLLTDAFTDWLATLAAFSKAQPLLAHLAPDTPLHPSLVRTADVIMGDGPAQVRPHDHVTSVVESADQLWGFVHTHSNPQAMDVFHEQVTTGMSAALIFQEAVFDHLMARYPDRMAALLATDHVTVWLTESLPYGLFLTDTGTTTQVTLLVYDDHTLAGVLASDHPTAVSWAQNLFSEYCAANDQIQSPQPPDLTEDD